jgi:hypothetical protein
MAIHSVADNPGSESQSDRATRLMRGGGAVPFTFQFTKINAIQHSHSLSPFNIVVELKATMPTALLINRPAIPEGNVTYS